MIYRCVLKSAMFLVVTGLCAACASSSKYQVVTAKTYAEAANRPIQSRLFLVDAQKLPDATLINHVNKGHWEQFNAKIGQVKDGPTRVMLQCIRLLNEKKYLASYQMLVNIPDDWQDCQALILKTDCLYKLKADSVDVRARYQQAFDCTSNETIKAIAKTRFRFVNYER
ncbi:hypothetical protein [Dawidia soli]|uniref:Lipoprotein n=1 Tax=Dawidia soli TaxID=2782352 RepID=A0AAP2GIT6_9BACT|nr:hypothetical protein [Dawidia soli]MBT1687785.1 hypothetical protein [Dawidia soli]